MKQWHVPMERTSDEIIITLKQGGVLTEHGEMGWGIYTLDPIPLSMFNTFNIKNSSEYKMIPENPNRYEPEDLDQ